RAASTSRVPRRSRWSRRRGDCGSRVPRAAGGRTGTAFPGIVAVTGSSLPPTRTDPSRSADGVDDRLAVARALREIGQLLEVEGGDPHRARAYRRGGQAVESIASDLWALVRAGGVH